MTQINTILPKGSRKFRETNADSVVFHMANHRASSPAIVTASRVLPTPRKGNPGTNKIMLNFRITTILDEGLPTERQAPVILKIETSIPVGTQTDSIERLFKSAKHCLELNDFDALSEVQEDLFKTGMLPVIDNAQFSQEEEV